MNGQWRYLELCYHKGIKLIFHAMKLWEKVIEHRSIEKDCKHIE